MKREKQVMDEKPIRHVAGRVGKDSELWQLAVIFVMIVVVPVRPSAQAYRS